MVTIPKRTTGRCPICGHYGSDCTGPHEVNADTRSPGQVAYEADCARQPNYNDGAPRRRWTELSDVARQSWEGPFAPFDVIAEVGRRGAGGAS